MPGSHHPPTVISFGPFEADLQTQELRKHGVRLRLPGQSFQILKMLLERPGELATREELHKALWPSETFVDFEHGVNAAVNRLREVLGDSADNPRLIETLPRRGYRFIAPVDSVSTAIPAEVSGSGSEMPQPRRSRPLGLPILFGVCVLMAVLGFVLYLRRPVSRPPVHRALTRLTFDDGLQIGATWSPEGRFFAYSSDRGGKFNVWVQQVSGGDPVQITKGPSHNWQPNWSPDGKYIAYRSEEGGGGLYVVPALGGEGLARKIVSFGYYPQWSPDSSQIMFRTHFARLRPAADRFYLVGLDGSPPREVLAGFISEKRLTATSAAWHPDGKRITLLVAGPGLSSDFWTVPVAGGVGVRSEIAPEILRQLREASPGSGIFGGEDLKFSWAPSGKAIYFGRAFRGARNLWKMTIDPDTLRATALERLTIGSGPDSQLAVSADGKTLAFTEETQRIRVWLFPFDATQGRVNGPGQAVTSPGVEAWHMSLSADGKKLAFCGIRGGGRPAVWEKSLVDGREAPIIDDEYGRDNPQWSPDGMRLSYSRWKRPTDDAQILVWSSQSHSEEPLSASSASVNIACDWSSDGERLLLTRRTDDNHRAEIWLLSVGGASASQPPAFQRIISDPSYYLYQPHFSPDGRWIAFNAVRYSPKTESTIYVVPADGGPWTRISKGEPWDDKPRWAPDGKTVYYVSGNGGFFNVWGIRFDPNKGKPVGEAFRVTAFEKPSLMVPDFIAYVGLSITQNKLAITVAERSGSIWMLDNANK
jgi:Tol biopolymer transport system component/DNA-binding winged helix-turn-helix (wHTH) protein